MRRLGKLSPVIEYLTQQQAGLGLIFAGRRGPFRCGKNNEVSGQQPIRTCRGRVYARAKGGMRGIEGWPSFDFGSFGSYSCRS